MCASCVLSSRCIHFWVLQACFKPKDLKDFRKVAGRNDLEFYPQVLIKVCVCLRAYAPQRLQVPNYAPAFTIIIMPLLDEVELCVLLDCLSRG